MLPTLRYLHSRVDVYVHVLMRPVSYGAGGDGGRSAQTR